MQLGGPGNSPLWNGDSAPGLKDEPTVKKQAWLPSYLPLLHQQPSHLARSFGYTLVMIRWGGKQSPRLIYGWVSLLCWCLPEWKATSPQPSVASKHSDEGKSPSRQSFGHVLQIKECVWTSGQWLVRRRIRWSEPKTYGWIYRNGHQILRPLYYSLTPAGSSYYRKDTEVDKITK